MHCVEIIKRQKTVEAGFIESIKDMQEVAKGALTSHWASVTLDQTERTQIVTDGHAALNAFAATESGKYLSFPSTRPNQKKEVKHTNFTLLKECDQLLGEFQKIYVPYLYMVTL